MMRMKIKKLRFYQSASIQEKIYAVVNVQKQTHSTNFGDDSEGDPPVPIPNTEVKPFSADSTWTDTSREGRSLPNFSKKKQLKRNALAALHIPEYSSLAQPVRASGC
jgi:hypothetical protein